MFMVEQMYISLSPQGLGRYYSVIKNLLIIDECDMQA
jgi:hypothetical protein